MTTKQTKKTTKKTAKVKLVDELVVLDLGCGENKSTPDSLIQHSIITPDQKDVVKIIGVDLYSDSADVKYDLTQFPYPFEDESVDAIFTSHFLEHLDGPERIKFFNETYRILKPGGKMRHIHPYYKSSRAIQDPTHKFPPIAEESYYYWDKNFREVNKLGHYLGNCDYEFYIYYTWQDPTWANKNEETRNFAVKHYFNIVADMIVDMKKRS